MQFILQLGRLPELSIYEITQLFSQEPKSLNQKFVIVELENLVDATNILNRSAGVIKAFQIESVVAQNQSLIEDQIVQLFHIYESRNFALFQPDQQLLKTDISEPQIKKRLKEEGIATRFIRNNQAAGLSAAHHLHDAILEVGIFAGQDQAMIARSIWVQNIDHWTIKDRSKPHADRKRGMLPPKLARMMINFVSPAINNKPNKRIFDPFCGTGTVLIEALEAGWQVFGSDISEKAVHMSAENLHWFTQEFNVAPPRALFIKDATHVQKQDLGEYIDAIVTEPFLGKQLPSQEQLKNIFKGLEKLYLGSLKAWVPLFDTYGEVVIVTPYVKSGTHEFTLEKVIDKSAQFGYSTLSGPLLYSRGETTVQRAIYHLKFEK